ncbi:hypothetical protein PWT90_03901 [Aphanocladium album]|nr:hypothetical protein PWT90_03901 [Aphanocladium album]
MLKLTEWKYKKYHWLKGTRPYYVHQLQLKYGPIVRIRPTEVHISDINTVKSVYATKETFRKSPWYRQLTPFGNHTIFNTDNVEYHRRHRRLLAGPLSETSLKPDISFIAGRVDLTIEKMKQEMVKRGCVDVYKWWFFFATDVIGELTFGDSFKMLELGKKTQYAEDVQRLGVIAAVCSIFPNILPLLDLLRAPFFKNAFQASQRINIYAEQSLSRHKKLYEEDENSVRNTLFSKVFKAAENENWQFQEIAGDARTYIIAGSDTTSNTLSYLVWAVCGHPEIKARLVTELQRLEPGYTEADLRGVAYLECVIQESMRRYPVAPSALPRVVPPGGATLSGYWLPEGVVVSAQSTTMHRHPEAFPDPEKFDPSRWESPTAVMKDAFMGFGKGARGCIGSHLAMIEMRLAVAKFFLEFPNAQISRREGMLSEEMENGRAHFVVSPRRDRCLIEVQ